MLTSREYKIMLRAQRFTGDKPSLIKSAHKFWADLKHAIRDRVLDTDNDLDKIKKHRKVRFLDTAGHDIRKSSFVLRERSTKETRELTLKFRHPDRYLAESQGFVASNNPSATKKFEEDIKPTFCNFPSFNSLYSLSTKISIDSNAKLRTMNDARSMFGRFPPELERICEADCKIGVVGYAVRELVISGADFQIGEDPKVECNCAITVWYRRKNDRHPLMTEFSFRYGDKNGLYEDGPARRASDVFELLQAAAIGSGSRGGADGSLGKWVANDAVTKTSLIYRLDDVEDDVLSTRAP